MSAGTSTAVHDESEPPAQPAGAADPAGLAVGDLLVRGRVMPRAAVRRLEADVTAIGIWYLVLAAVALARSAACAWQAHLPMITDSGFVGGWWGLSLVFLAMATGFCLLGSQLYARNRTACGIARVVAMLGLARFAFGQYAAGASPTFAQVVTVYAPLFYFIVILTSGWAAFTPEYHAARATLKEGPPRPQTSPVAFLFAGWLVFMLRIYFRT